MSEPLQVAVDRFRDDHHAGDNCIHPNDTDPLISTWSLEAGVPMSEYSLVKKVNGR